MNTNLKKKHCFQFIHDEMIEVLKQTLLKSSVSWESSHSRDSSKNKIDKVCSHKMGAIDRKLLEKT